MPMDRSRYPANWDEISRRVKERAGWRCQNCGRAHGEVDPDTGVMVVLTTAHLNHDPSDNRDVNLRALCAACHLRYDAKHHATNAGLTRREKREAERLAVGQRKLFGEE